MSNDMVNYGVYCAGRADAAKETVELFGNELPDHIKQYLNVEYEYRTEERIKYEKV